MTRVDLIQALLDRFGRGTYLEIGVKRGYTFLRVQAVKKIAVDPQPRISRRRLLAACLRNPWNLRNSIHRMESDRFFQEPPRVLQRHRVDVVFVDGLHTYEQSLRDVHHALPFLRSRGTIVLHDCNPLTPEAAMPLTDLPDGDPGRLPGGWSGDVWKTIVHLRSLEPGVEACVLDADCGLGVVTRGGGGTPLRLTEAEIRALIFDDLEADRQRLLGLRPPQDLHSILEAIAV